MSSLRLSQSFLAHGHYMYMMSYFIRTDSNLARSQPYTLQAPYNTNPAVLACHQPYLSSLQF